MTHTYKVSGMTCDGCIAKVSHLLKQVPGVTGVEINLEKGEADISMEMHITTTTLRAALKEYPKYQLTEASGHNMQSHREEHNVFATVPAPQRTWLQTYKPIVLIFLYITAVSIICSYKNNAIDFMVAMRIFMSGFFLTFSLFKMLDLKAFASSYAMYDIVAKQMPAWGYIYAFVELSLGLAYAADFAPLATNVVTAVAMSVSLIGVLQSVLQKKKIQCACLGAVFNLPMSTVTIIEDALMI
ncbi:MAG: heavy-metal-associated domain-containing protein, partial [Sphingobacteriales bacterium]